MAIEKHNIEDIIQDFDLDEDDGVDNAGSFNPFIVGPLDTGARPASELYLNSTIGSLDSTNLTYSLTTSTSDTIYLSDGGNLQFNTTGYQPALSINTDTISFAFESGARIQIHPNGEMDLTHQDGETQSFNIFELVSRVQRLETRQALVEDKISILMDMLPKKLGTQILRSKNVRDNAKD